MATCSLNLTPLINKNSKAGRKALIPNLSGSGIVLIKLKQSCTVPNLPNYDITGVWYSSNVDCKPSIFLLLLGRSNLILPNHNNYGLKLEQLVASPHVSQVKLLKIKKNDDDTLFRTLIYSTFTGSTDNAQHHPRLFLRSLLESLVVRTNCAFTDYLKMITLLQSIQEDGQKSVAESEVSTKIDTAISNASKMLQNYFKDKDVLLPVTGTTQGTEQGAGEVDLRSLKGKIHIDSMMKELESMLFDEAAIINL